MRTLLFTILIIVSQLLFSNNVDSLKRILPKATESEKIELYIRIAKNYSRNILDSSEVYCNKTLTLAEKTNDLNAKATAFKTLGSVNFFKGNIEMAQEYYEQALSIYQSEENLKECANIYNNIGSIHLHTGKYDKANEMLEKALSKYEEIGDEQSKIRPLINIGIIHIRKGEYELATTYYSEALEIAQITNDFTSMATISINQGAIYKELGNYQDALKLYHQAIEYEKINENYRGMAAAFNNIGMIYHELGNYSEAINNITIAYELRNKYGAHELLGNSLIKLGDIYSDWDKLEIALDYYHDAIEIQGKSKNKGIIANALVGIGHVYFKSEVFNKALDSYLESAKISEELGEKAEVANIYMQIGKIYALKLLEPNKSEQFLNKSKQLFEELGSTTDMAQIQIILGEEMLLLNKIDEAITHFEQSLKHTPLSQYQLYEIYDQLSKAYKIQNDPIKLNEYLILAQSYKDSIHMSEKELQTVLFESHYNLQIQKQENSFNEERIEIINSQLTKRKSLIIIVSAFAFLLLIVLVILFYQLRKAKNSKRKIISSKKEIKKQKELLEEANAQLLKSKIEAEKHNEFKSEFLANVSHELRTPLNAIIGYSKLMYENAPKDYNIKYLDNIIQASDNLVVIIDELLDFSKIEAGKMLIDKAPFNPVNVVTQTISTLRIYAEEKSNPLDIHIDPDMPQYVIGDQKHLHHILTNIIHNAIKFSKLNTPVSIEAHCSHEGTNCILTFIVTDKGIGINESEYEAIFESFIQVKNNINDKYSGTGLGLAIVKRLIELQEGTIAVKSSESEGTTFSIHLPYKIVGEPLRQKQIEKFESEQKENIQEKDINILLVEDNEINQELAMDTILSWGDYYKIDVAENGKIAIEQLKLKDFDLILMDIQMPEMDGHEATLHIRNNMEDRFKDIPIIGMTAHALQSEKDIAMKNGMNDYIIKPFDPNKLKQIILNTVINRKM